MHSSSALTDAELVRRRPVWRTLSDLFLDTEFNDDHLRQMAGVLRASGYSRPELERILEGEIAPLLWRNLASPAGRWDGFDLNWIERQILAARHRDIARWHAVLSRIACGRVLRAVKRGPWKRLTELLA